jgi:hypothetical protein
MYITSISRKLNWMNGVVGSGAIFCRLKREGDAGRFALRARWWTGIHETAFRFGNFGFILEPLTLLAPAGESTGRKGFPHGPVTSRRAKKHIIGATVIGVVETA